MKREKGPSFAPCLHLPGFHGSNKNSWKKRKSHAFLRKSVETMRNANTCSGNLLPFSNVNKNNDEFTIRSFWAILSQLKPPKRKFLRFFQVNFIFLASKTIIRWKLIWIAQYLHYFKQSIKVLRARAQTRNSKFAQPTFSKKCVKKTRPLSRLRPSAPGPAK